MIGVELDLDVLRVHLRFQNGGLVNLGVLPILTYQRAIAEDDVTIG